MVVISMKRSEFDLLMKYALKFHERPPVKNAKAVIFQNPEGVTELQIKFEEETNVTSS